MIASRAISLDIETMPNEDMVSKLPEVEASKTLKDPEKIEKDIANKRQEQIDKMALSPLYGKIACIGLYSQDYQNVLVGNEEEILKQFFEITKDKVLITYNGLNFDIPFIYKRACIYDIFTIKDMKEKVNKYKQDKHIDLMNEFCSYGQYEKLDTLCSIYLNENKIDFDVKTIKDLIKTSDGVEKLKEYCLRDVELTYKLAIKFGYIQELFLMKTKEKENVK